MAMERRREAFMIDSKNLMKAQLVFFVALVDAVDAKKWKCRFIPLDHVIQTAKVDTPPGPFVAEMRHRSSNVFLT